MHPNIVYTAYSTTCYLRLGPLAQRLLSSPDPRVNVSFPIKQARAKAAAKKTPKASATLAIADDDGWISARQKTPGSRMAKKGKVSNTNAEQTGNKASAMTTTAKTVVEVNSSSSEPDDEWIVAKRNAPKRKRRSIFDDDSSIDEDS